MSKDYEARTYFWRNKVIVPIALRVIGLPLVKIKQAHCERYRPKDDTFLLIANHNEIWDPAYEMVSLRRYIRFVSSDHVMRESFWGGFLHFFGTPIFKHRERPSEELNRHIIDSIRAGISVCIHAEGGVSFNGESRYILPHTASLIKRCNCAVITYRSVGGYLRAPRWKRHGRRGPLYSGVVREYSREEIGSMTEEQVYKALCKDLYVNSYDEQRKNPHSYVGESLAESCEIILYMCPKCGHIGSLHSSGNFLKCDCGYKVEMRSDGFFHDCGNGLVYDNICEWEHWQRKAICGYLDRFRIRTDTPALRDDGQILIKVEDGEEKEISRNAVLELYSDRIKISWENGVREIPLDKVKKMDYVKRQSLLLIADGEYFNISSVNPRSATKYLDAWRYLTGRPNY